MNAVRAAGLEEQVVLRGAVVNVREYYHAADIFVHTSNADAMPNVLLEAMHTGLPIVATRVGGVPLLVEHGRSALLYDAGDAAQAVSEVRRLMSDSGLADMLARGARSRAGDFEPDRIIAQYEEMLNSLSNRDA